jgi:two-component system OmpR family sensor kinase
VKQRLARLSLLTRIIAVLVALLLVTCGVVAVVSAVALHKFLIHRLDQQLADAGQRYAVVLEHPGDHDTDDAQFAFVIGQPTGTLGARVAGGTVTAAGVVGRPTTLSTDVRAVLAHLTDSAKPQTVALPGLGDYRLVAAPGRDRDVLITGLPERPVDETTSRLATIEAIVFGAALLLAAGTGVVCVRLSLRPLRRVAGTAHRVSALPLASGAVSMPERVPNPAPDTEVGQVAGALNQMLEHVESSLEQRHASEDKLRHFVADASHELRTPVAVIVSHAEFVLHTAPDLSADVQQAVARIAAEAGRMGRLVDDLLLLARLDADRPLDQTDVDLTRIALDAAGDLRRTASDHRWQLDLPEEPLIVRGDEHALHQALTNLLTNAATHTPAGTTVTVAVVPAGPDGTVHITVRDDGPGIPAEVLPHVFERFSRGDHARSPSSSNAGLGLSIVQAIIEAHGGRISVTSEAGATEFDSTLPG